MKRIQAELLKEMYPNLEEVQKEYGPLLKIISINAINPAGRAVSEVKKYGMDFTVLLGRGSGITRDYQVSVLPLLVIIDKEGIIREYTMYLPYDELKAKLIPVIKEITNKNNE